METIFEFAMVWLMDLGIYLAMYFIMAGLAFFLFWKYYAEIYLPRRIQSKPKANELQIRNEIKRSLVTLLMFACLDVSIYYMEKAGYTLMYSDINEYGLVYFFLSIFLMFLVHDTYFYWTHRIMHHKSIFKYVHKVHHESIDTTPYTSFSFHPIESFVEYSISFVLVFMIPGHILSLIIFQILSTLYNVIGHMGYELYPTNWYRIPLLKYKTPSTHHNLHHSKFNGNYGLYFTWWDRWMGTEISETRERFEEITKRPLQLKQVMNT